MPTARAVAATTQPAHPIVPLAGHGALLGRLVAAAGRGSLPGSLLLQGPRGVGKQRLALSLAEALLCSAQTGRPCRSCINCRYVSQLAHPDLHWFFPRPKLKDSDPSPINVRQDYAEAIAERVASGLLYQPPSGADAIYVATVRAIGQIAALTPAVAQRKVIVIGDAERMVPQEGSEAAANALLKLLEEPPADTTIVLTSSEPGALLPTIRSRVAAVRVAPVSESEVRAFVRNKLVRAALDALDVPEDNGERIRLAQGAPGRLLATSGPAMAAASALLDATGGRRVADRYRAALAQGASGARGTFADTLDALTTALRDRAAGALRKGEARRAQAAVDAIAAVEIAKERANGNVNPQLVTASLLRALVRASATRSEISDR